ncbi:hypothetical protein IC582_026472 [Cucumis melo]
MLAMFWDVGFCFFFFFSTNGHRFWGIWFFENQMARLSFTCKFYINLQLIISLHHT